MKIEVLGVGGAFAPELGNTSFLIWDDAESSAVLMDCGYTVFPALRALETGTGREIIRKIGTVFISHLHGDHVGSFPTLLQYFHYRLDQDVGVTGVDVTPLLDLMCGGSRKRALSDRSAVLLPTEHGKETQAFGGLVNGVLYSGDSVRSLLSGTEAKAAKIIVHESGLHAGPAHVGIDDLAASAPKEVLSKTWLTHYSPDIAETLGARAGDYGFAGLLRPGQVIDF